MAIKIVNGEAVEMSAGEEAEFEAMRATIRAEAAASIAVEAYRGKLAIARWGAENGRPGLYDEVEAAVAAAGTEVRIWWTNAPMWRRDHPQVEAIGTAVGLSSADKDAIMTLAQTI